jgi:hypothetical protein
LSEGDSIYTSISCWLAITEPPSTTTSPGSQVAFEIVTNWDIFVLVVAWYNNAGSIWLGPIRPCISCGPCGSVAPVAPVVPLIPGGPCGPILLSPWSFLSSKLLNLQNSTELTKKPSNGPVLVPPNLIFLIESI